jgi:anti-sigma regulatory factor (Ser/Thr protein kinase)
VVRRLDRLVLQLEAGRMATLLYMRINRGWSSARYASAGHLPAVLLGPDGTTRLLEEGRGMPLGVLIQEGLADGETTIEPGSSVVLYTDGLVERRGESLDVGIAALCAAAASGPPDPEAMADHILEELIGPEGNRDDVGLLVLRRLPLRAEALRLDLPADPKALMAMRHTLERWLTEAGATHSEASDIQLACHEAASNAIEHGYKFGDASFEVTADIEDGTVRVAVSDKGAWQAERKNDRGRGFAMMKALMDHVEVSKGEAGTTVDMRRRLQRLPGQDSAQQAAGNGEAPAGAGSSRGRSKPKASPR